MAKHEYTANDIQTLTNDRERMQKMAHLYIPDKKLAGCLHVFREIFDNATDEVKNAGGKVDVYFDEAKREISVKDSGRGMPQEKLQELCEVLHSSGKFEKGENSAYSAAGGLHGVGLKCATYLSEYFILESIRDGKSVTRKYEDGIFLKEETEKADTSEHGTIVTFKLSDKYLDDIDKISCKKLQKLIEEKTDCCEGIDVVFHGLTKEGKKIKEKYSGLGINELMKKYMNPTSKTWQFEFNNKDTSYKIAIGYDTKAIEGDSLMGWTNYIYNKDGGTHVEAIADSVYEVFKKFMLNNVFSDKDKKNLQIRKEDARLGLCGVVVITTTKDPQYYGQFKQQVTATWLYDEIFEMLSKKLNKLSDSDMRDISKIIKDNIKARLSSQKARQQVKKVGNGLSKDQIVKYIPPRMGCTTTYSEVFITEGDSAGEQCSNARFDYQGIYKLRG